MAAEPIVRSWRTVLIRERDLVEDVDQFLASASGLATQDVRAKIAGLTQHDADLFLNGLPVADDPSGAGVVVRWLARRVVEASPLSVNDLDEQLRDRGVPWLRVIDALAALVPVEHLPALMLVCTSTAAVDRAARLLENLTAETTILPVAIVTESSDCLQFLEKAGGTRHATLVREGLHSLPVLRLDQVAERLENSKIEPAALIGAVTRLKDTGISADLVDSYAELVRTHQIEPASEAARSCAEQFLHDFLESCAATSGLFHLNGSLDFRFGRGDAEVDLVCSPLRLAIELDGYHHFLNPEAYRRDRRKDYALQCHGYLVLRFLTDDVVLRLEEILDTILDAIDHCRSRSITGSANGD